MTEDIPLFFTWIPILALLSNYDQEICLIHVGTEGIAEAQRRKLGQMVDQFQREPDDARAHRQWKEIEKTVFGIEYPD